MRHSSWLLWVLVAGTWIASAQPSPKKPWQYSDDERIARRVDRESIRERAPQGKGEEYASLGKSSIRGKDHPELFLPWELYRDAVSTYLAAPEDWRTRHRARANDELRVFTDPLEFWNVLALASAPYAAMLEREHALLQKLNAAAPEDRLPLQRQIASEAEAQCAARAAGLAAAEQALGRETLYRFLYEIVAPPIVMTSSGPERAAQLRFVAGGCR
jgi:hypothetical protein